MNSRSFWREFLFNSASKICSFDLWPCGSIFRISIRWSPCLQGSTQPSLPFWVFDKGKFLGQPSCVLNWILAAAWSAKNFQGRNLISVVVVGGMSSGARPVGGYTVRSCVLVHMSELARFLCCSACGVSCVTWSRWTWTTWKREWLTAFLCVGAQIPPRARGAKNS